MNVTTRCAVVLAVLVLSASGFAEDGEITPDIVYGHKDGLALTMDRFPPTTQSNRGAIVFLVSGGWVSRWSPPEHWDSLFAPWRSAGFTVFAVRHGSSPRYGIPDAVSDVRRAVRFLHQQAEHFNIDADRLGAIGMSAGGHLALVLATTGDDGDPEAADPVLRHSSRVRTVAALVPPTDLRGMIWSAEDALPVYRRFPALDLTAEQAARYSPRLHVTSDDATALVISGTEDKLVPSRHGEWIAAAYEEQQRPVKLLLLDANHGLQGHQVEAWAAVQQWFQRQLDSDE